MVFELGDGIRVRIRPIEPEDKERLVDGLRRLSDESIRKRFLAAKPRFTRAELRYLTEVDGVHHLALVAVLEDDPEQIVAVARCVRLEPGGDTAEFAIVVGDPLQRQGLGTVLATALADAACQVGIRAFAATTLADNEAVQRLMDTFAMRLRQNVGAGGVRELTAELPECGSGRLAA